MANIILPYSNEAKVKTIRNFKTFWFGFVLYTVSYATYTTDVLNRVLCVSLQLLGLLILASAAFKLTNNKFENKYLRMLCILLAAWIFVIICRGLSLDFAYLKQLFFFPFNGILLYFVPLILLFPLKPEYYRYVFSTIITLGVIFIFFDLLFLPYLVFDRDGKGQGLLEYFSKSLSLSSGFVLLTYIYHSNKRNLLAFIVILITLLLSIIRARRGLIFMSGNILFFLLIIYLHINRQKPYFVLSIIVLALLSIFAVNFFNSASKIGILSFITERMDEDTRSRVEEYFYADMTQTDWVIGKGLNGMYYAPTGDENENPNAPYRDGIETDYLTIILKGGFINLALLLFITLPAVFKGLCFSKNILSKASAIWILLWLIALYPSTVTTFTLSYLLVWLSIAVCYSKRIRNLSDDQIQLYLM